MNWLIVLLTVSAMAAPKKATKKKSPAQIKMNKVDSCKGTTPEGKKVLLIKQWHLAPTTVTKGFKEKYPQEKNQTAIYKNLSEMVKKQQLQVLVAEGCEGEIDGNFKPVFNGWTITEMEKQAQTKGFEKIISHVPMKLEARWGDKLVTICGDDEALIKDSSMHLSNLRGWMGFWTRLNESGDRNAKHYADAAADILRKPKDTSPEELKKEIHKRAVEELDEFNKSLNERNAAFVKALGTREYQTAAIVIGGLHAEDLKNKLEATGLGCEVYEPPGYSRQDESVIKDFAKSLKN